MNKSVNVLVLGVGGKVSQGIVKALRKIKEVNKIVGACVSDVSAGYLMCDSWSKSPYCDDDSFIDWVIKSCLLDDIDIIVTGVEEIVIKLDKHSNEIYDATKSIFISPGEHVLNLGRDKLKTVEWLKNNEFNYPQYSTTNSKVSLQKLVEKVGYPLIAKPKRGKGSESISIIKSEADLRDFYNNDYYIIQEYIGSEDSEYTVGCYIDKNKKVYTIIFKRLLSSGATIFAEVVDNKIIKDECINICEKLDTKGAINIQLRLNEVGLPICFELNTRFSGTTAMRSNFGFCDVEALINEYVFNNIVERLFKVRYGKAYRYDEELYVFDDVKNADH